MADPIFEPLVMLCPACGRQHIDEGDLATAPHVEHDCSHCGHRWSPHEHATVGVPLGTLSEGWLFDVAVVHGPAAEEAIKAAWARREVQAIPPPPAFGEAIPVARVLTDGPAPIVLGPFRDFEYWEVPRPADPIEALRESGTPGIWRRS
jgi:hypothetical protein